jgi:N-methylhydantoinase B
VPPWGLWGGHTGGKPERLVRLPGENDWKPVNANWYQVPPDTRAVIRSAGGGGWGDPLERDPARVLDDIRDGMVSLDAAKQEYGVVAIANGHGGLDAVRVDADATRRTRQEMRAARAG